MGKRAVLVNITFIIAICFTSSFSNARFGQVPKKIFEFNANSETCIQQFARLYSDYDGYLRRVYYCNPDNSGGGDLTVLPNNIVYNANGDPELLYKWEVRQCGTGVLTNVGEYRFSLCAGVHLPPLPPKTYLEIPTNKCGSIIKVEDQIVGESIPIVGSNVDLNYFSNWTPGRVDDYKVVIPFTGNSTSGELLGGSIKFGSGSITIYDSGPLSPSTPNQSFSYTWTPPAGSIGAQKFWSKTSFEHANSGSGTLSIEVPKDFILGSYRAKEDAGLGGWQPSSSAFYDNVADAVFFGDGSVRYLKLELKGTSPNEYYQMFSENGDLLYVFYPSGRLHYLKTGRLGTVLETYSYGTHGLNSISYPFGKVLTFNRNSSGQIISITAPNGQITSLNLDSQGYLASVTNPNGETHSMTYSSSGLISTFTKPGGEISEFDYDSNGRLLRDTHSGGYFVDLLRTALDGGSSTVRTASPLNRISSNKTDGDGGTFSTRTVKQNGLVFEKSHGPVGVNTQRFQIKEFQRIVSEEQISDARFPGMDKFSSILSESGALGIQSVSSTSTATLSDNQDPLSITSWVVNTSVNGTTWMSTQFDKLAKKYSSASAMGKTQEIVVDDYERVSSVTQGNLTPVTFTYSDEKLMGISQGARQTTMAYNAQDRLSSITDPLGNSIGFVYDTAGRVISKALPDNRVIEYGYNLNGDLVSVTPPSRPAHQFTYNSSELISGYNPPVLSGVSLVNTAYVYNADKQLTSIQRPDGVGITFNYNATTGFLESYTTPEGTFTQTMDTVSGKPDYIYRPDGSKSQIMYGDDLPTRIYNYGANWENLGYYISNWSAKKIFSDTAGGTTSVVINYLYNQDHQLSKAGDLDITYDVPNGYLSGTTLTSGSQTFTDQYTYNSFGEVTGYEAKWGSTTIYQYSLTRNNNGQITGKSQTYRGATQAVDYIFDSSGRLTQTNKSSAPVATYVFDDNGNRIGGIIGSQPTTATYDSQDRMLTYNTLSFSYNANGDLTSKTNNTTSQVTGYNYDVFGNLRTVVLSPLTTITYDVDGLNRRIAKRVNGVVQRRWVYMDQYRIAAELNAAGAITKRFVYGSKGNIPDYMIMVSEKYRIVSDHLGSPRLVVRMSDGRVMQKMDYDEFGRVTLDSNTCFQPFGFAGGLWDHETGLVRFGARDYDPEVGRWTSKDPILFNGDMANLYGYSFHDPVNFIDMNGLSPEDVAKIKETFKNQVSAMTSSGQRRDPGLMNNYSRSLNDLTGGMLGSPFKGCIEQADVLQNVLSSGKYDDKWSFNLVGSDLPHLEPQLTFGFNPFAHHWVEAVSSNPSDPVLIIDPWRNIIKQK